MTDLPIIMQPSSVRAILREIEAPGTGKSQTRRLLTPHNCTVLGNRVTAKSPAWRGLLFDHPRCEIRTQSTLMLAVVGDDAPYDLHLNVPFLHPDDAARGQEWEEDEIFYRVRPIWEPGDRLWVRETHWRLGRWVKDGRTKTGRQRWRFKPQAQPGDVIFYVPAEAYQGRQRGADQPLQYWKRSAIFLPRRFSRLTLLVTATRIERVQEISPEDCIAEGIDYEQHKCGCEICAQTQVICPASSSSLIMEYAGLWQSLHTKPGRRWEDNPQIVAISFKPVLGNIDVIKEAA